MTKRKSAKIKARWWRRRLPVKWFWPLAAILFLFFALTVFNLFSLWQVKREFNASLEEIKANVGYQAEAGAGKSDFGGSRNAELSVPLSEEASATPLSSSDIGFAGVMNGDSPAPSVSEQALDGTLASFGDIFSSLAYINEAQSDMFWDENMTAFTFPPLYEVRKQSDCSTVDCGLSRADIDPSSICLQAGCLRKTADLKLFFNNQPLQLPPPVNAESFSSITLFSLGNSWLIGLVSGPETAERGWVYRFDGLSFSPLITADTDFQIAPRFQRGGGSIAFGGTADDFLVLYAGYDGRAFRFRGTNQEDISKFFGLRVTDGGFKPQILKVGEGGDSIFYVCSLTEDKPKVIKIWSKDDLNSLGALDFSLSFFKGDWRPDSILCSISDAGAKRLAIASKTGGAYALWQASDLGFDNSRRRSVTSLNINRKNQTEVKAAVLADVGVESLGSSLGGNTIFYLANKIDRFENAAAFLWHGFDAAGTELYWRLEAEPDSDRYYSPWFSHVNRLDYLLAD